MGPTGDASVGADVGQGELQQIPSAGIAALEAGIGDRVGPDDGVAQVHEQLCYHTGPGRPGRVSGMTLGAEREPSIDESKKAREKDLVSTLWPVSHSRQAGRRHTTAGWFVPTVTSNASQSAGSQT